MSRSVRAESCDCIRPRIVSGPAVHISAEIVRAVYWREQLVRFPWQVTIRIRPTRRRISNDEINRKLSLRYNEI